MNAQIITETQTAAIIAAASIPGGCSAEGVLWRMEQDGARGGLTLAQLRQALANLETQGRMRWYRHADGCGGRVFQAI